MPEWNKIVSELRHQVIALRLVLLAIYVPVIALLCAVVLLRLWTGVSFAELFRDPASIAQLPVYIGSISHLGVNIWSGTVAICLFSYGAMRHRSSNDLTSPFLLYAGLFTLLLAMDDLYQLHEGVFRDELGIPEEVTYTVYALLAVGMLVLFRSVIWQSNYVFLVLALASLGLSVGLDVIQDMVSIPGWYLIENGPKLFGIVSWAAYFTDVSLRHIRADGTRSSPSG